MTIEISRQYTELTDSQRRVYNGCAYSSKQSFRPWETLESGIFEKDINKRLNFWVDLNNYAVSQRGENSRNKYRIKDNS